MTERQEAEGLARHGIGEFERTFRQRALLKIEPPQWQGAGLAPEGHAGSYIINVLGEPKKARYAFLRLVTNEAALAPEERRKVASTDNRALVRTRDYLRTVLEGEGGKPYCPFVHVIEKANGYRVHALGKSPGEIPDSELYRLVNRMHGEFRRLSPAPTHAMQLPDTTVAIVAFSHPEAMEREFCMRLEEVRNDLRQEYLDQGLMLAHMTPHHERGSSSNSQRGAEKAEMPVYVSGIPVLVMRRMHRHDKVFMHAPEAMAAYDKYFGNGNAGNYVLPPFPGH